METGSKKIIRGWVFYDWANSVYNLVISSAIFPIFFESVTRDAYIARKANDLGVEPNEVVARTEDITSYFFGVEMSSAVLYTYILSASFLVVSILSPIL